MNQASLLTGTAAVTAAEPLSTTDLVLRCQRGFRPNSQDFAELVRRHQTDVERILYHLAPDWPDRHDLAQEVWIRVYRHIRRLKEPLKFRGWLGRITTNLFYDELRKSKRQQRPLSLDAPLSLGDHSVAWDVASDAEEPHELLVRQEFYDVLRQAMQELPPVFRETIVLREIQGLAYEDIAALTGVSLGTVKSRIARARCRLQESLKPYLQSGE